MDFAIRNEARDWFRDIRDDFKTPSGVVPAPEFDTFYFCFMAGIITGSKADITASKMSALVENFPGPYKNRGRLLVALFLRRELDYLGVTMVEKQLVRDEISRLVDPEKPNYLSDEGVREFNRYASGGFEVLKYEWFQNDRPRSLETFLREFKLRMSLVSRPKDTA